MKNGARGGEEDAKRKPPKRPSGGRPSAASAILDMQELGKMMTRVSRDSAEAALEKVTPSFKTMVETASTSAADKAFGKMQSWMEGALTRQNERVEKRFEEQDRKTEQLEQPQQAQNLDEIQRCPCIVLCVKTTKDGDVYQRYITHNSARCILLEKVKSVGRLDCNVEAPQKIADV